MEVQVLFFAVAREAAGAAERTVTVPEGATVAQLRAVLGANPELARVLPRCRIAVNRELATDDAPLSPGAEVAVIPPVAGGAGPLLALRETSPSLKEAVESVEGPDAGGIVTFTGTVRDASKGRQVVRLTYEAYGPMAERVLQRIAGECTERFGARVSIVHAVGTLTPGQVAVVIAAAAPHRSEAFDACRHAIESLKAQVPIWKKEHYADGTEWVGMGP